MMNKKNILNKKFFNRDALLVAKELLGKVLRVKYKHLWLSARITETEAYYLEDKASHASLGFTEKRKALFMPAGTIYMYYARGKDSLNFSTRGKGNAVLIKSAVPYVDQHTQPKMLATMQALNLLPGGVVRSLKKLCAGQTLLCKALALTVKKLDQKQLDVQKFYLEDVGYQPQNIIQTRRMGIPPGRDEHLPYRMVDENNRFILKL